MSASLRTAVRATAVLVLTAVAVVGCGGSDLRQPTTAPGPGDAAAGDRPVRVVHSILPMGMDGDDTKDVVAAMRLALEEHGQDQGAVRVNLAVDDDSGADGDADPARTKAVATEVVADPASIGIIGTMTSSGSMAMAPITNRASLPVLAIAATAVGLTRRADGQPGMPPDAAPTGNPTMVRIVPNDARQAVALTAYLKKEGVGEIILIHDTQLYGAGLTAGVAHDATRAGIRVRGTMTITGDGDARRVGRAAALALSDTRRTPAILIAANSTTASVAVTEAAALANDRLLIFGPDSMALRGVYANLLPTVERRVYITSYLLPIAYYGPMGVEVFERLRVRLGRRPTPTALYGYEAMALLLSSIAEALPDDASLSRQTVTQQRAAVTRALLHTHDRGSVVGTYSIDVHGDTQNSLYGAYRVENRELVRGQVIDTEAVG